MKTSPTFAVEDILAQDIAGSLHYSYLKDFKQYFSVFTSSLGLSCIIQTFGLFCINMKKNIKYKKKVDQKIALLPNQFQAVLVLMQQSSKLRINSGS